MHEYDILSAFGGSWKELRSFAISSQQTSNSSVTIGMRLTTGPWYLMDDIPARQTNIVVLFVCAASAFCTKI